MVSRLGLFVTIIFSLGVSLSRNSFVHSSPLPQVARAMGERTDEEKQHLNEKIAQLQEQLDVQTQEVTLLSTQHKIVGQRLGLDSSLPRFQN